MTLRFFLLAGTSIALLSTPALAQSISPTIQLGTIVVDGNEPEEARPTEGAPGVIETDGYVTTAARSGTKTETPLLEVPFSVSNVTQSQLEDRKPQSLLEALNYTPGAVVGQFGFDPRYDAFKIRGFDVTYTGVFRDGLRQLNSPNGLFRLEPYGLEAITILKGPASAIYGASSTAGIVDLITKRPLDHTFREVELQTGSFGRIQGNFDLSGPANEDGTLLYRLTGVARDAGTEIDAVKDDRVYIAPALTWRPSDSTSLTLLAEYMDSTTGGTAAYVNIYDGAGNSLGATRGYAGDARFNEFRQKQGRIGWEFEHRFDEVFTLHQNTRYSQLDTNQEYMFQGYPGLVQEDTGGIVSDTYIVSEFATGAVGHRVLTGIDFSYLDYSSWAGYGFTTGFPPVVTDLIDRSDQTQTLVGIYVQDQMEFGPWRLLLGGRHDWLESELIADIQSASPPLVGTFKQSDTKFTGRAGLTYVTEWGIAPYISYGTSFTPNAGAVLNNTAVAVPTTGEQIEIGVKYDIPDVNASLRAAVFDIKQENAVVYAVVSGTNEQTQLDLTSRGFEFEATASLARGFSVLASYAYTDVEIDRLTPETEGKTLSSVPFHSWSMWADYTVQSGFAQGLGIGAGVRYVGSSFGDNTNRPILDNEARTFVDASLRYDLVNLDKSFEGMRLQINATNLLDEVKQVCSSNYCYWDEGRKVIASLRYRF